MKASPTTFMLFFALSVGLCTGEAQGQSDRSAATNTLDLVVPGSPAFTALGMEPTDVVHPSTARELAGAILNGADKNGNLQTGLALDVAPYLLLAGNEVTLADYQSKGAVRFLSRLQFSFGTTKGVSDDDPSTRAAAGLRFSIFDRADPRMDTELTECLVRGAELTFQTNPPLPPHPKNASEEEKMRRVVAHERRLEEVANVAVQPCREESEARRWNNSAWIVGGAVRGFSQTGKTGNLKWDGGALWTSISYGFEGVNELEDSSQLILLYKYLDRERIPLDEQGGQFSTQDVHMLGGRARFGTNHFSGSFEGVYVRRTPVGGVLETSYRWSVAAQKRLSESLWLEAAYGVDSSAIAGGGNSITTSLNWAFSQRDNIRYPGG